MADAPDNAAYLLNATDLTLTKSKVLTTDSHFNQVTTATTTSLFPTGTLAGISNVTDDGFIAFCNSRMPVNPVGPEIVGTNGVSVTNGQGILAGNIIINLTASSTEQNITVQKNGTTFATVPELNFQATDFANFVVNSNSTQINVMPLVDNRSTIFSVFATTDSSAASVLTFSSETTESLVTLSLEANFTGATTGQCMAVNEDGDVKWQTPLIGLNSLDVAIDQTAEDILELDITPNNPILASDTATVTLTLKPPVPYAQKYLRWDTATSKFIYADLDENAIDSLGMTILPNSTNVLTQTTPTLTGPGAFEFGFTGGTEGQVVAVDQVEEEMIWAPALKSVDVLIGANASGILTNLTENPITTTGTISLGLVPDTGISGGIISYDSASNAVIVRPNKDGAASITSVDISTSVGSGLAKTGSAITTTGTLGLGFDTTGASAGNIFMNTGGSMGWGNPASVNTSMARVVATGYSTLNTPFGSAPNKRYYRQLLVNVGSGLASFRFVGVAFPQKRGATLGAVWNNLICSIPNAYADPNITLFVNAYNPPDDQDSTLNNGRGFNYIIYYIPA